VHAAARRRHSPYTPTDLHPSSPHKHPHPANRRHALSRLPPPEVERPAAEERYCCICQDLTPGLCCRAPSAHFTCNGCFDDYVQISLRGGDVVALAASDWALQCPMAADCPPRPPAAGSAYTHRDIALHARCETFILFLAAREASAEQRGEARREEVERQRREARWRALQSEEPERAAFSAEEARLAAELQEAMTLRRPCCGAPVAAGVWDACAAVTCDVCPNHTNFCGVCLGYSGTSRAVHEHLRNTCPLNRGRSAFPDDSVFRAARVALARPRVEEVLQPWKRSAGSRAAAAEVLTDQARNLADINLSAGALIASLFLPPEELIEAAAAHGGAAVDDDGVAVLLDALRLRDAGVVEAAVAALARLAAYDVPERRDAIIDGAGGGAGAAQLVALARRPEVAIAHWAVVALVHLTSQSAGAEERRDIIIAAGGAAALLAAAQQPTAGARNALTALSNLATDGAGADARRDAIIAGAGAAAGGAVAAAPMGGAAVGAADAGGAAVGGAAAGADAAGDAAAGADAADAAGAADGGAAPGAAVIVELVRHADAGIAVKAANVLCWLATGADGFDARCAAMTAAGAIAALLSALQRPETIMARHAAETLNRLMMGDGNNGAIAARRAVIFAGRAALMAAARRPEAAVVVQAVMALCILSYGAFGADPGAEERRTVLTAEGAASVLLAALQRPEGELAGQAARALDRLMAHGEGSNDRKGAVLAAGGAAVLVAAVQRPEAAVVGAAVEALGALTYGHFRRVGSDVDVVDARVASLIAAGAIAALVVAVRNPRSETAAAAAGVLERLADRGRTRAHEAEALCDSIVAAGAAALVEAALRPDAREARAALGTLRGLSKSSDTLRFGPLATLVDARRDALCTAGAVVALLVGLRRPDVFLVLRSSETLLQLASHGGDYGARLDAIVDGGGVAVLLDVLQHPEVELARRSLELLCRLSDSGAGGAARCAALVEGGVIPAVLAALRRPEAAVAKRAAATLSEMMGASTEQWYRDGDDLVCAITAGGGVAALLAALQRPEADVARQAANVLGYLAWAAAGYSGGAEARRAAIIREGGIAPLLATVRRGSDIDDVYLADAAIIALTGLADDGEGAEERRSAIFAAGAVAVLLHVMRRDDSDDEDAEYLIDEAGSLLKKLASPVAGGAGAAARAAAIIAAGVGAAWVLL
jgi:hypothetical protein